MLAACGKSSEAPKKQDAVPIAPVPADAAAPDAGVRPKKVFVHGAARCAECHEKMYEEWKPSAHAHAASSPLYLAARKNAGNEQCGARCHTPLASALGETDPVAAEGITCDVCHTLRDPKPSAKGGEMKLAIDDMVKFGPRCDLEDHYFHRMGCSKEHASAQICGSCHWWERNGIPVFTEYKDFMETDDAQKGVVCQDCHMPGERAPVAEGSPVRADVPHHGLLGITSDLRARMLAVEVSVTAVPPQIDGSLVDGVQVEITVSNTTAAHYIPSGLPERRIEVRAKVIDDKDVAKNVGKTWALGRHLGDETGAFAPFWRAKKVIEDTRIPPGGVWRGGPWRSSAPNSGKVVVEVAYRGLAQEAATLLGVTDVEEQILAKLEVPFGPATGSANRAKLPRTATFVPSSPGKRAAPPKQQKAKAP